MRRRKGSIHPAVLPSFRRRDNGVRPSQGWVACVSPPIESFRDGPQDQTRNLEILRCAIAHHSSLSPRMTKIKNQKVAPMPVVLDPDAAAVYKAFQEAGRPPYETVTPAEARQMYLNARLVSNPEPPELESVKDIAIPGPGGPVPARVYMPKKARRA